MLLQNCRTYCSVQIWLIAVFFDLYSVLSVCIQNSSVGLHCIRSQDSVPSPLPTAFSSTSSDSVCSSICEHVCCAVPPSPPESICLICLASDVGNTNIRESLYSPHAKARIGLVAEKRESMVVVSFGSQTRVSSSLLLFPIAKVLSLPPRDGGGDFAWLYRANYASLGNVSKVGHFPLDIHLNAGGGVLCTLQVSTAVSSWSKE